MFGCCDCLLGCCPVLCWFLFLVWDKLLAAATVVAAGAGASGGAFGPLMALAEFIASF